MTVAGRRVLHAVGLLCFAVIIGWAVYRSPPDLFLIKWYWLLAGFLLAGLASAVQGLQMALFLKHEQSVATLRWSFWFTAEKAWMNTVFPVKAGTAGALLLLDRKMGVSWARFVKFMLLCSGLTAGVSIAAALAILPDAVPVLVPVLVLMLAVLLSRALYPIRWGVLSTLTLLALAHLMLLSLGIAACLAGLGHGSTVIGIVATGVILNLLSIVSVTPGNFGVREVVLTAVAPLLALDFSVIVQGAACYVILRLFASLLIATVLRGGALTDVA
ncbi:MAG TPA: hypothetical protein VIM96_07815 [Pseudomonadales bacterium]